MQDSACLMNPDDLFRGEATLAPVRPLGLTDFTASRDTAQWGQVTSLTGVRSLPWRSPRQPRQRVVAGETKDSDPVDLVPFDSLQRCLTTNFFYLKGTFINVVLSPRPSNTPTGVRMRIEFNYVYAIF